MRGFGITPETDRQDLNHHEKGTDSYPICDSYMRPEPAKNAGLSDSRMHQASLRRFLHIVLDFPGKRISIGVSPPIQFRIEWADSQGMSPLLGCRLI